ncbi:hypothetical protein [Sorangium sp. So ce426]|uniref:hypothetical protein n=1 Tax=unclassified Sorangium TaxID=2621164 RepID=UPI003F5BE502
MSFLNRIRLAFSGTFQADVSTVNNDVGHFDDAKFKSSYQSQRIVNLSDPQDVKLHAKVLKLAFSLPVTDPNYMPVTQGHGATQAPW